MAIERGINDLQTIRRILQDLETSIALLEEYPNSEVCLRRLGNVAGLLAQRIQERPPQARAEEEV